MSNITATIIQDSICNKVRLTTFELEYPRFIHAEFMTHRMLSKNCASSRAIPVEVMHKSIADNMAQPVYWGKNQAGMQAKEELGPEDRDNAIRQWARGCGEAIQTSRILLHTGLHKQISNRVTEPFQMMKTVATATEWANLLHLRDHEDAQPEFKDLANKIRTAFSESTPFSLLPGDLHVPYITRNVSVYGGINYSTTGNLFLTKKEALEVSVSCCAQVSYRKSDDSLEKAKGMYDRLVKTDGPMHASPLEHQAWGMDLGAEVWQNGVTHIRHDGSLWSANFKGWIQHRQTIEGNTKW